MSAARWLLDDRELDQSLPEDVLQFIKEYIDRIAILDVLLLLQSAPARAWTATEVSNEMRSSPRAAEGTLDALQSRGLLAKEGEKFSFRPRSTDLEEKTARLAACYQQRRIAVITAIFSGPNRAVRSFAEAFRFRKGGSDG
ncbi:MAG TPA: hypothetical protein VI259_03930 [Gemmatimonadaceae bacterium]